jgi:hypothetical protein
MNPTFLWIFLPHLKQKRNTHKTAKTVGAIALFPTFPGSE